MNDVSFEEARRVWWRVALHSFGGPAGQIAVIHRAVVEERRWIDEAQFLRALGYCMLLPGPEAQQLATYLGWRLHGVRGGLTAGLLFVLPGFVAILALSVVYLTYGDVGFVAALFAGVKPAVLTIVLQAVLKLRARALRGWRSGLVALLAFTAIFALDVAFPLVLLGAAATGIAFRMGGSAIPGPPPASPPLAGAVRTVAAWLALWLAPVALLVVLAGPSSVWAREAVFFSKAAVVTFGGAYAVLAYVAQQAVEVYGWLQPGEMLDGLGMAETTPGPLIMVVQFVGFMGAARQATGLDPLVAGILGSVVTTWVTFAPCFLFIFAGAPYVEVITAQRQVRAALAGVMAAVVGVVLNLAVWFGLHTLVPGSSAPFGVDPLGMGVFVATLVAAFRFKVGMFGLLGLGAAAGLAAHLLA
ncbi:MAG: hypothetical protein AMXMBFR53_41170 [Gemmatimonadota bacterium]